MLAFLRRYDFPRAGSGDEGEGDAQLQHRLLEQALTHAQAAQVRTARRVRVLHPSIQCH